MSAAPKTARWLIPAGIVAAAALAGLPFVSSGYVLRVAITALISAVLAQGMNVIVGYAGILNIGYVAYYCVGAYAYSLLASGFFELHLPFLVLLPVSAAISALLAAGTAFLTSRMRGDYLAVTTLGFAEVVRILINNTEKLTGGPKGVSGIDPPVLAGFAFDSPETFYFFALAFAALASILSARIARSKIGRSFDCLREDEDAAEAIGIDTRRMKITASAIGGAYAGIAGVLFASYQGFVSPESFQFGGTVTVMCMVVLGGLGSIAGTLVGTALLTFLPEFLRQFADFRMLFYGLAFVLFMVFRPQGIVPSEAVRREYQANRQAGGA